METNAPVKQQQSSIRKWHLRAAISVWVAMLGSVSLYLLFVWLNVWRPHIAWWWLSAGLVVLSAVASFLLMLRQLFGGGRIRGIGVFMISVIPLVWLASFLWSTTNVVNARGDVKLTPPILALGVWVGSYFELEARWRYPRVTEGKHVILFDDGTSTNVETLIDEMDQHIEQMAETLETPVPKVKTRWVRGSLFGQTGRTIGAWAICSDDQDPNILDSLDRHEVAHATLTTMCPVAQDMPMLFCEGWATFQGGNDQAAVILSLIAVKESSNALTLDEIVTKSYGRSTGPAYTYGAPLVIYLIERFGGAKFVELHGSVSRDSFAQDFERISGVAWDQLEEDFWAWLESRRGWAKNIQKNAGEESFSFDRESDKERWQEMLAAARQRKESIKIPDNVAFKQEETGDSFEFESKFVFEGDCLWKVTTQKSDPPTSYFQIATPEINAQCVHEENTIRQINRNSSLEVAAEKSVLFGVNRLARFLMVDLDEMNMARGQKVQIHRIEPEKDSPFWKFSFTSTMHFDGSQKMEALLDPAHFFDIVETIEHREGGQRRHKIEANDLAGAPIVTRWTTYDGDEQSYVRTITPLSPTEAANVKEAVDVAMANVVETEEAALETVAAESSPWGKKLVSPVALAIAWPVLGAVLLLVDFACDRIRWKAS